MDDHEELLKRATIEANGWASAADRLPTSDPGHLGVLPEAAAIVRALSAALLAEQEAHEETRRELARYGRTSDEWEGNAEDAMRDLEKARAELAAARKQIDMRDTCVVCHAVLADFDQPPHCLDCVPTDEHREAWEEALAALGPKEGE